MVCFVVLHYQVLEETLNCIKNLQGLDGLKSIIVVDNRSPNGSGERLKEMYDGSEEVTVLLSSENGGFAKGNNIGYRYARQRFDPGYIVVMNNDIEITQSDFIRRIQRIYEEETYAVLGPDIYSVSARVHQSPKRLSAVSYDELKAIHEQYGSKCGSRAMVPLRCWLKRFNRLKLSVYSRRSKNANIDYGKVYYDVPLHGSCFVFARPFIEKRAQAFFEGTFMYYESEILNYECDRDGLKQVYNPSVKVLHYQNVATNAAFNSELKKVRFMNRCIYNSTAAFIGLWDRDNAGGIEDGTA